MKSNPSTQMNTDEIQMLSSLKRSVSICVNPWLKNRKELPSAQRTLLALPPRLPTNQPRVPSCVSSFSPQINTDETQMFFPDLICVYRCQWIRFHSPRRLWLKKPERTGEAVTVIFSIAFWPSRKITCEFGVACEGVWRDDFNVANEPG